MSHDANPSSVSQVGCGRRIPAQLAYVSQATVSKRLRLATPLGRVRSSLAPILFNASLTMASVDHLGTLLDGEDGVSDDPNKVVSTAEGSRSGIDAIDSTSGSILSHVGHPSAVAEFLLSLRLTGCWVQQIMVGGSVGPSTRSSRANNPQHQFHDRVCGPSGDFGGRGRERF